MRLEVYNRDKYRDGRINRLICSFKQHEGIMVEDMRIVDVYTLTNIPFLDKKSAAEIFSDSVVQDILADEFYALKGNFSWDILIEVGYKPGVTDTIAITAREAVENYFKRSLPEEASVRSSVQYLFKIPGIKHNTVLVKEKLLAALHNELIEEAVLFEASNRPSVRKWEILTGRKSAAIPPVKGPSVEVFDINGMNGKELIELSKKRLLALSLDEMKAIQNYFLSHGTDEDRAERGLADSITDVELEMIAQTWSEHCKHKIFNAVITYRDGADTQTINSLFKTFIAETTEEVSVKRNYLRSVFDDNSGVVRFDNETLLCFKVETHNSPSALDPYGGAITGIVGVNRDIMGTGKGARPIFNTNVLCFGYPDTPHTDVPDGLLHPRKVMEGVHRGIVDGGNQSGIPVAGGAFLFDESFLGKPLVFCGTGGVLPSIINGEDAWVKHIDPGDLAVMVGGRIGKDGIHGATFSSLALDEASPSSAVQIGDPITQKKMFDFLLEARDLGLYKGITDNGAGGLSSSLGEMAENSGGVEIYLDSCPLKYKGLKPWEILVSESQERMSLSVDPEYVDDFFKLAAKRGVEASVVGKFTDSGYITIYYGDSVVGNLSLEFLHRGLPKLHLEANWETSVSKDFRTSAAVGLDKNLKRDLLMLLADPNAASKENLIRQYDHEVQGLSIVKPFTGAGEDAPSDGAVFKPRYDSDRGITVTHGICPRVSEIDTYSMAMCAVDEAVRAHVALGGDPAQMSALDNFCWPDPVVSEENPDGDHKLAQLVRACMGLKDACIAYGLPLISGKDSMKNNTLIGDKMLAVKPTLLVSLMGIIPDIHNAVTTDFKKSGDAVFIVGNTNGEMGGSLYSYLKSRTVDVAAAGTAPKVDTDTAFRLYNALYRAIRSRLISSCHDLSDGGLGAALAESALGGRLGVSVSIDDIPGRDTDKMDSCRLLFCETPSRFLVSLESRNKADFIDIFKNLPHREIGTVTAGETVSVYRKEKKLMSLTIDEIEEAFKSAF